MGYIAINLGGGRRNLRAVWSGKLLKMKVQTSVFYTLPTYLHTYSTGYIHKDWSFLDRFGIALKQSKFRQIIQSHSISIKSHLKLIASMYLSV